MASIGELIAAAWRSMTTLRAKTQYEGREVDVFVHDVPRSDFDTLTPGALWATQPHLRTVVDFRARNLSQLTLQLFERTPNGRRRVRDGDVARALRRPNPYMTGTELIYDLMATRDLFDTAYWFVYDGSAGREIVPFPPEWVTPTADFWSASSYRIQPPGTDAWIDISSDNVIAFRGYTPSSLTATPVSKVDTLRDILAAQAHSWRHRINLWLRGTQTGGYVSRPADAPQWDDSARKRFLRMFEAFNGAKAEKSGGVALLEDGMKLESTAFKSADEQWAESVKLSLETVAQVFQVNPTMVGVLDNANYSNVQAFNRQLYTNALGPDIALLEDRINGFVLPLLGAPDTYYVKFNVEAKMRGSFEEQTNAMSTAIGSAWMTRNEGRALLDMSPIEGGDELVVPLNVVEGGQASPRDGKAAITQRKEASDAHEAV